jgi:hypothetical protein
MTEDLHSFDDFEAADGEYVVHLQHGDGVE